MLDALHNLIHGIRPLAVVLSLTGLIASGYLYWRAWNRLAVARPAPPRRTRRLPPKAAPAAPADSEPQQPSLLSDLESSDRVATERVQPGKGSKYLSDSTATTQRSKISVEPGRAPTKKMPQVSDGADEDGDLPEAIRSAVAESLGVDSREDIADETAEDDDGEPVLDLSEDGTEIGSAIDSLFGETDPDGEREQARAEEQARRQEELGFHRQVTPDEVDGPAIDAGVREQRISELDGGQRRMGTVQLDEILDRLDRALDDPKNEVSEEDLQERVRPGTDLPTDDQTQDDEGDEDEEAAIGYPVPSSDTTQVGRQADLAPDDDEAACLSESDGNESDEDETEQGASVESGNDAKPPPTRPDLPSWARADTFDEDEPPAEPRQEKLF